MSYDGGSLVTDVDQSIHSTRRGLHIRENNRRQEASQQNSEDNGTYSQVLAKISFKVYVARLWKKKLVR